MPIRSTCPHCGEASDLAGQYAGQTVNCSHCGKAITVPLSDGDWASDDVDARRRPGPRRWSTCLLVLLGCLFVMIVIALMLPPVGAPREAGRQMQCINNLQRIGLAMRNYELEHGSFPPSFIPDESGKPKHSWRVLILPFLGSHAWGARSAMVSSRGAAPRGAYSSPGTCEPDPRGLL